MYQFSEETRKALEQIELPLSFFQEIDGKNIPVLVSDGFCRLMGLTREQMLKEQQWSKFDRIHPEDVGRITQALHSFWRKESNYDVIYRARYADNQYHYIHSIAFWWPMEDGTELIPVIYLDLQKWGEEVRKASNRYGLFQQDHFYTDPLTGLPNINYLNRFGDERAETIRIHGGEPVLIYTDVQAMQFYNNHYGFERGNDLMRLIAEELKAAFPEGLVARGADDHYIVIDAYADEEALRAKLTAVNAEVRKKAYGNTSGIQAGVSLFGEGVKTTNAVDRARQTLKNIRDDMNQVVSVYTDVFDEKYWNQRYVIENFEKALQEGWIRIYYQCILRTETRKGAALEALARWIDPVRGIISPGEFIPVLRRYHLLYKLDLYMMEQVFRDVSVRAENSFEMIPVSINFAAQDFDYVDIPAAVNELYDRYGISRYAGKDLFVIEITEEDIASSTEGFRDQLLALKQDGYRLWLDDFGSGYSSLSMFSRFNFNLIKFDMDLLRHLDDHNSANRRIIRAMTGVARELGIHVLAEGVETEEQLQFLRECGCELSQGYLFHRPEPLEAMLYRRKCGQKPRACETAEEREANMRKWFEKETGGPEK